MSSQVNTQQVVSALQTATMGMTSAFVVSSLGRVMATSFLSPVIPTAWTWVELNKAPSWRPLALGRMDDYLKLHCVKPNVLAEIEKEIGRDKIEHLRQHPSLTQSMKGLQTVLAGYYTIATRAPAPDRVMDDVRNALIWGMRSYVKYDPGAKDFKTLSEAEHYAVGFIDSRAEGFYKAYYALLGAKDRLQKVLAIDAISSLEHDSGSVLDLLFGFDPEGDIELGVSAFLRALARL